MSWHAPAITVDAARLTIFGNLQAGCTCGFACGYFRSRPDALRAWESHVKGEL